MSAASVAVVVTSGERHEGKAGMVLFAGKTVCLFCVDCLIDFCFNYHSTGFSMLRYLYMRTAFKRLIQSVYIG